MNQNTNELHLKPNEIIDGLEWNQKQDIYYYNPKDGKEPKLIGKDLESFTDYLDSPAKIDGFTTTQADINREAFAKNNQNKVKNLQMNLYIGRDKNANEELFKKYLRKYDIYLNPSKQDFEQANIKAGLNKQTNLTNVVQDPLTMGDIPKPVNVSAADKQKQQDRESAKRLLDKHGLKATEQNINKMAKNIDWERQYNKSARINLSPEITIDKEFQYSEIRKQYEQEYGVDSRPAPTKLQLKKPTPSRRVEYAAMEHRQGLDR